MAQTNDFASQLIASQDFFNRSTRVLDEGDAGFRPSEGMMTVVEQIAHAAQTLEWFVQGATRPEGFDLNFEAHAAELARLTSLAAARQFMDKAYATAIDFARTADLTKALPEGPIMGGQPTGNIIWAMIEHTAHHRGALTVYSRLLGKVPPMPYAG